MELNLVDARRSHCLFARQDCGQVRLVKVGHADGTRFAAGLDGLDRSPCALKVRIGAIVQRRVDEISGIFVVVELLAMIPSTVDVVYA